MYPQQPQTSVKYNTNYLQLFYVLLGLLVIFQLAHTAISKNSTGILQVNSTDPTASLTVLETYKESSIGKGNAKVRLKPGNYTATAIDSSKNASATFNISKGKTTTVNMNPVAPKVQSTTSLNNLPSVNVQAADVQMAQQLPTIGPAWSYTITYKFTGTNNSQMVLTVTAPDSNGQNLAKTYLTGLGFDLSQFNVQYITAPIPH